MPNSKQIKWKIKSVSNIKQITKALEVVATVKLQKIKKQTDSYKEFMIEFLKIVQVLNQHHPIFGEQQAKSDAKELIIVIGSDRGLCGSLNSKLFKEIFTKYEGKHKQTQVYCVGKKSLEFFSRSEFDVVGFDEFPDSFTQDSLAILFTYIQDAVQHHRHKSITIYFNYFENALKQTPIHFKLFPINKKSFEEFTADIGIDINELATNTPHYKDIILEPNKETLANELKQQLIQHIIYGASLQNKTGEFAARMIAMKNAKDNSTSVIKSLQLSFNKARQAAVTQEVSEIMSAKMALED
jgi:F-type H+-transporting ATPase subunit gamma